jgi:hypothetical protein
VNMEWIRPTTEADARFKMLEAEKVRAFDIAALAALSAADQVGTRSPEGAASYERQALVYATLHQANIVAGIS